jgi:hypothetical protein
MLFPKPVSARQRVRHSLARIISDIGDLYGSEIGGIELEIDAKEDVVDVKARQEKYRGQFQKIMVSVGPRNLSASIRFFSPEIPASS